MSVRASVVVSTYQRPDALRQVLCCLAQQDRTDFEIIVADDGSGEPTREVIEAARAQVAVPLIHAWQPDAGFQLARVRNLALTRCSGDLVIFLDGDCLPWPDFVSAHLALAEPGWFVRGNRILCSEAYTTELLGIDGIVLPTGPRLLGRRLRGHINRLWPLLPLSCCARRYAQATRWQGAKGCNLAIWRQDLETVNGFANDFTGWGLEDTECILRLFRAGIRRKEGSFKVPVLHLWHPEADRSKMDDNAALLAKAEASETCRAANGLAEVRDSAA